MPKLKLATTGFTRANLAFFALFAVFWLTIYRYQLNPDAIAYISVAERYLRGDFWQAVSTYWSPLFSWLLTPLLALGAPTLATTKALCVMISALSIFATDRLAGRMGVSLERRRYLVWVLIPVAVYFGLSVTTPDLLMTTILLFYLSIIASNDYAENKRAGLWCGLLGGAAYLTKTYAFFYFFGHFTFATALLFWLHRKRPARFTVLRHYGTGLLVFAAISCAWMGVMAKKYGTFSVGITGGYNMKLAAPGAQGHPMSWIGLVEPPPYKHAYSIWDDPWYQMHLVPNWNPLQSLEALRHEYLVVKKNAEGFVKIQNGFNPLWLAALLAFIAVGLFTRQGAISAGGAVILFAYVLFPAGYLPVLLNDERYVLLNLFLVFVMTGMVLDRLFLAPEFKHATVRRVFLALLALTFLVHPLLYLRENRSDGRWAFDTGTALKNEYKVSGRVASNCCWDQANAANFHLGARYVGKVKDGESLNSTLKTLREHKVDYYFHFYPNHDDYKALKSMFPEITQQRLGFGVFDLNSPR